VLPHCPQYSAACCAFCMLYQHCDRCLVANDRQTICETLSGSKARRRWKRLPALTWSRLGAAALIITSLQPCTAEEQATGSRTPALRLKRFREPDFPRSHVPPAAH
jgi:hypothetical protein